jgi:deazaflavin-dependent oxidoreductase (nitroreductase family)
MATTDDEQPTREDRNGGDLEPGELRVRLGLVAEHEAQTKLTWLGQLLKLVGRTRAFAVVYRRIGPPLDTWLGRRFKGQVAARMYGLPALVLVTTGAKTGLPRPSPLLYVREGEDFLVVGTNFGQGHHPAWTNNLLANRRASVEVGPAVVPVLATLVDDAEFSACWPRFVDLYPGYAGYLERSGRSPRMFRLRPRAEAHAAA